MTSPKVTPSTGSGEDARAPVSRRAVTRGMVWSVPVIATALPAPAFAASCTALYTGTTNWSDGTYSATSTSASSGGFTASNGRRVGISFSSSFTNYQSTTVNNVSNLGVTNPVGGTNGAGVKLGQAANSAQASGNSANNQTVTVKFDVAVYNLSFLITDIDSNANQFSDAIAITNTTFSGSVPANSSVSGSGTTGAPYRQTAATVDSDTATGTAGNVQIQIAGPVTSFNIVYWNLLANPSNTNRQQAVWIANMTGSVHNEGCNP